MLNNYLKPWRKQKSSLEKTNSEGPTSQREHNKEIIKEDNEPRYIVLKFLFF